jgi:hypothetical protein
MEGMYEKRLPLATAPQLEALEASLADLHAILCDVRPTGVETAMSGRILTCVLEGGMTSQETYLIELGHGAKVRAFREQLFRAAGADLTALIETLTQRSVNAWVPVFEPQSGLSTLVFVLDAPADELGDPGEALGAWAAQVRRKAQSLRDVHRQHRERQHELAELLRSARSAQER